MTPSFLPTTTHKIGGIIRATLAVFLLVGLAFTSFLFGRDPASVAPTFDHSVCQYPDRITNPVDGCDNSDLVNPDTSDEIKGIVPPTTTSEIQKPVSHNIETVEKPVEVVDKTVYDGVLRDNFGNPIAGK